MKTKKSKIWSAYYAISCLLFFFFFFSLTYLESFLKDINIKIPWKMLRRMKDKVFLNHPLKKKKSFLKPSNISYMCVTFVKFLNKSCKNQI